MQIDRAGSFRGKLTDWGVSETKNGYPQFVGHFKAEECYDEEAQAWMPWTEFDQEIDGYLCLYTLDKAGAWKELLSVEQLKKVLGWDGLTFQSLATGDYSNTPLMFRVEEDDYNGQIKLKVQWIDVADGSPTRQLKKFDTSKLAGLTAKFSGVLKGAAPTPASAPKPASAKPAVPPRGKPGPKPKAAAASPAPTAAAPAPTPTACVPPTVSAPAPTAPASPSEPTTKASAWQAVNDLNKVGDEKLAEVWIAEAQKIGKAEDQFTPADWKTVQEAVLAQVSVF